MTAGLFAETPGRILVTVDPKNFEALRALAKDCEIPFHPIGKSGGDALTINGAAIPLTELRRAHTETLPRLFG